MSGLVSLVRVEGIVDDERTMIVDSTTKVARDETIFEEPKCRLLIPKLPASCPAQPSFNELAVDSIAMTEAYRIIGMMGSFVISSSLVPQMYKVYRTKSAKDISLMFQLLYVIGLAMILLYGFGEDLWPIYIPATLEMVAGVTMLCMKLYFDRYRVIASHDDVSPENDFVSGSPMTKHLSTLQTP